MATETCRLGLKTFAFNDRKQRTEAKNAEFAASFDIPRETAYDGIEKLLVDETPAERHWQFLEALRNSGLQGNLGIPAARPTPEQVAQLIYNALKSNKGNYYAGQLIELCSPAELPRTITTFLREVYALFPKPERPAVLPPVAKGAAAPAPQAPPGAAAAQ